jgi:hypothetical protein
VSSSLKHLTEVYSATTFRVAGPSGSIDIRVGMRCLALDDLLMTLGQREWAYVTAWNPHSELRSVKENAAAHQVLLRELATWGLGQYFEGDGIPDNPGWAAERSVWIAGIARADAIALGIRFGQNAVVLGRLGGVAELVFCRLADSAN